VAFASLGSITAALAAPAAASQVTFLRTLAGPSEAAMYPSGLISDPTWPTSNGPIAAVVVADTGYNRISVFDPDGARPSTPILQFGSYGTANGQFNTPRDVAVDQESNIYVADAANGRIQAFNSSGTFLWSAAGHPGCKPAIQCLSTPIGISFDASSDEVLVADTGHSLIKAYAGEGYSLTAKAPGSFLWASPAGLMKSPREARRGPDGGIWVADYNDEQVRAFHVTTAGVWTSSRYITLGDGAKGGHGINQLNSPYNVAFSPDGHLVYVADTGNERIAVWSIATPSDPVWQTPIGARCPSPCPAPPGNQKYFQALRRVTVDASGNLWGADFWGSGLHEFSPSGNAIEEIDGATAPAPGFAEPYGVTMAGNGDTYVVDRLNQRIEEFNAAGAYMTDEGSRGVSAGEYSWPEAAAVAPDGSVWVGDTRNSRLEHFPADLAGKPAVVGTEGTSRGQFDYIEGVTVASNGVVWVADTDNNRIESYNPANNTFATYGTKGTNDGQFNGPEAIAVSATDVYVADTLNNRVEELTLNGTFIATYPGLDSPQGIALAPDGSVWVANSGVAQTDVHGNDIVHLSSSLALLVGGFGGPGGANLQFFQPHSLAVSADGSTLFVADTYNNRVQEFDIAMLGKKSSGHAA
jgi:tripartite motif-containing protein 71